MNIDTKKILPNYKIHDFYISGYPEYYTALPKIDRILTSIPNKNGCFSLAVSEAVCNAARYNLAGPQDAAIHIRILLTATDAAVTVRADTRNFDALHYRENLMSLARGSRGSDTWGQYTGTTELSRGFWLMLMACEYILVDAHGQAVTLISTERANRKRKQSKIIADLVQRFFVIENGVVK